MNAGSKVAAVSEATEAIRTTAATAAQALETIPKFRFLFSAYVLIFVVIFVFLMTIYMRQRRLDREIAALERKVGGEP